MNMRISGMKIMLFYAFFSFSPWEFSSQYPSGGEIPAPKIKHSCPACRRVDTQDGRRDQRDLSDICICATSTSFAPYVANWPSSFLFSSMLR